MAETFRYKPEWEGPLSGRSFEKQTEDAINALWAAIESIGGGVSPSDALPQASGTASAGVSAEYSRGDHVHPKDPDPPPGSVSETLLWEGEIGTGSFALPIGDEITNYDYLVFVVDFRGGYPGRYTQIFRAADCVDLVKLYIGYNTRYVYGWFTERLNSFYIQNAANATTRKLIGIKL